MSYNTLSSIFNMCNSVLSRQFTILGISFTLWQFIAFDLLATVVFGVIFRTFEQN